MGFGADRASTGRVGADEDTETFPNLGDDTVVRTVADRPKRPLAVRKRENIRRGC